VQARRRENRKGQRKMKHRGTWHKKKRNEAMEESKEKREMKTKKKSEEGSKAR